MRTKWIWPLLAASESARRTRHCSSVLHQVSGFAQSDFLESSFASATWNCFLWYKQGHDSNLSIYTLIVSDQNCMKLWCKKYCLDSKFMEPYPKSKLRSHCCCINIHINNNVQGVTDSVLLGTKVLMRDSGVRYLFRKNFRKKPFSKRSRGAGIAFYALLICSMLLILFMWN